MTLFSSTSAQWVGLTEKESQEKKNRKMALFLLQNKGSVAVVMTICCHVESLKIWKTKNCKTIINKSQEHKVRRGQQPLKKKNCKKKIIIIKRFNKGGTPLLKQHSK